MVGLKSAILLIVIAVFDSILTIKVREATEKERDEVKESNEYDMKSIFYYINQDSKEKKHKIAGYENDEQQQSVKVKEIEQNEEPGHIKVKERENEEPRHIKIKERENNEQRFVKVKERENNEHHNKEKEINQRKKKEKQVTFLSNNRNMTRSHRAKEENDYSDGRTPNPKKSNREFAKIVPTVGSYVTPKITSIKTWNYKTKGTKSKEEDDVSKSFADDYHFERKLTPKRKDRKRRNKDKRQKIGGRRNKEGRNYEKKGNNLNNDYVISKEINMTKSFKSDQPVDIIVHIKMKN